MAQHPTIKKDGNTLVLVFPSEVSDLTHSTAFPITEKGITQLIRVLSAIECKPTGITFATEPEPIQHIIDQWLRENKVTRKVKPELDPLIALATDLCPKDKDPLEFLKTNRKMLEQELDARKNFALNLGEDW